MKISLTPLPLVEGKCPPVSRIALRDGRLREEWYYPDPIEDWKDPEIYETDNYRQEEKEEFYDYVTVCQACQTKFIAYKAGEKTMNYCPCCGKQLCGRKVYWDDCRGIPGAEKETPEQVRQRESDS